MPVTPPIVNDVSCMCDGHPSCVPFYVAGAVFGGVGA